MIAIVNGQSPFTWLGHGQGKGHGREIIFQMVDLKLLTAFIAWTTTTFVAHYSVKRILVAAAPGGAGV